MPFQKGHKLAKGGKREGAGRKTNKAKEIQQQASAIAREYIESRVKPLMDSYFKLINGRIVRHYDKATGALICEEEVIDSAAVRHAVDTIVPKRAPEDKEGNAVGAMVYKLPNLEADE